jgi:hypothetical protein
MLCTTRVSHGNYESFQRFVRCDPAFLLGAGLTDEADVAVIKSKDVGDRLVPELSLPPARWNAGRAGRGVAGTGPR